MLAGMFAAALDVPGPVTFSGALSVSATGSTTVTGSARTVSVPSGNNGGVRFDVVTETLGDLEYQVNADAFAAVSEDLEIFLVNLDTLRLRGTSLAINESITCNLIDQVTNSLIEAVTVARGGS